MICLCIRLVYILGVAGGFYAPGMGGESSQEKGFTNPVFAEEPPPDYISAVANSQVQKQICLIWITSFLGNISKTTELIEISGYFRIYIIYGNNITTQQFKVLQH